MASYDFLMLAVLGGATIFGAWKGLAWQLASLSAILVSYLVAFKFRMQLAGHINIDPPWNVFVSMLVLYVGSSFLIWIAFQIVKKHIDRLKLKEFDRQLGATFGLAKGILLCVIVTLFAVTLLGEARRKAIVESRSGYYIAVLLDKSHAVMPDEVHEVLEPYIHSLDERLDRPRHAHGSGQGEGQMSDELHKLVDPYIDTVGGRLDKARERARQDFQLIPVDELLNARDRTSPDSPPPMRR